MREADDADQGLVPLPLALSAGHRNSSGERLGRCQPAARLSRAAPLVGGVVGAIESKGSGGGAGARVKSSLNTTRIVRKVSRDETQAIPGH